MKFNKHCKVAIGNLDLPHSDTALVGHEQGPEFQPQHLRWPSSWALALYVWGGKFRPRHSTREGPSSTVTKRIKATLSDFRTYF